ncbi:MAG: nucleotidyltransferase family protein [Candidatus Neomarinimicrobiota bacterium]
MKVAAIVLAAGSSERLPEKNKLLLEISGIPMIKLVCASVEAAGYDPIIVVTGYERSLIRSTLKRNQVLFVHNDAWETGMSGSIRTGITTLPTEVDGCAIVLGDMPLVKVDTLRTLRVTFDRKKGAKIVYPLSGNRQGNPVLFPKTYFTEIMSISSDQRCKSILNHHIESAVPVELISDDVLIDCDTQRDYLRLLEKTEQD